MIRRSLQLLAFAALTTGAMMANQVTIKWGGVGSDPSYSGVYVGPYLVYINGSTTPTAVVCDDFNDAVNTSSTGWTANVSTILNGTSVSTNLNNTLANTLTPTPTLQTEIMQYEEIAYLSQQFSKQSTADWAGIATAIWSYFGNGKAATDGSTSLTSTDPASTGYWLNMAKNNYSSTASGTITIYTPVTAGSSQELVTYTASSTPEPATFAIFGGGLLVLSIAGRRRLAKRNN